MSTQAVLDRLVEERSTAVDFVDATMAAVEAEERDLSETEIRALSTQKQRIEEIDGQIEPLQKFLLQRASAIELVKTTGAVRTEARPPAPAETRSLGTIFTESDEFKNYSGRGSMKAVEVPEFRAVGPDPLLTTTAPGNVLMPEATKFVQESRRSPMPLLNYVGRIQVSGNSASYVTIGDATGAAVVAEGAAKPPVVWTATEATFTLETIAGWFKSSRQAIEDIVGLRSLIDQKIRRSIDKKLNELATTALLAGFGAGNTTTGKSGDPMVEVVRTAIATLEGNGVTPTAVLANPADLAAFDIAMLGKPLGAAQVQGGMWGLPVVPVPGLTAGEAVVGDISEALIWFYRSGLHMYATDSDISGDGATAKSDFRTNILTFLGEVRGKFQVVDQSVIQKAKVTP